MFLRQEIPNDLLEMFLEPICDRTDGETSNKLV